MTTAAKNVATSSRSLLAITARKMLDRAIRAARLVARRIAPPTTPTLFVLHPTARTQDELGDLVNRATWYLPDRAVTVEIGIDKTLTSLDLATLPTPANQARSCETVPANIELTTSARRRGSRSTRILVHRWKSLPSELNRLSRVEIVDPPYFSTVEASTWANLQFLAQEDEAKEQLRAESARNFERLRTRMATSTKAYVFTTGPSIDAAESLTYEADSLKIVCNSMVRNRSFLDRLQPQVVTFADPVFHFSPCRYSAEFRQHAISAIERYDSFCIVPEPQAALLLSHYPHLCDRLIGMPVVPGEEWNWPTRSAFRVTATENIMTLFMIPVAASLCSDVAILGADGRKAGEKYFWKHSSSNQFDELMDTAFQTHPSFFRDRVYTDYYERHCQIVASQVDKIERAGGSVRSLTPSFIPALAARTVAPAC